MRIGYHASHEQFSPRELLDLVVRAERAGFDCAMCSEHLLPWSEAQGQSGFAWSWLGAAMHATSIPFGLVTTPGYRYHPTIPAHAAATLQQMFPDRLWVALGSGEELNEHVTGEPWPPKDERDARLRECADVIRRLWRGEWVTHRGRVTVVDARVYSLPERPPGLFVAAISPETAAWAAPWADGVVTVSGEREHVREVIRAFRSHGGARKPIALQVKVSWHEREDVALAGAREQWATNVFSSEVGSELRLPRDYERLARDVDDDRLRAAVRISSDLDQHVAWLREDLAMGFDDLYVHCVNRHQAGFVDAFGAHVLPALRRA